MRNMSFMLTTEQIRNRTKTVTRRLGWDFLKSGDLIRAVEKCQGLKKGEKLRPLAVLRVRTVILESLHHVTQAECEYEGFPEMTPAQFIAMFCDSHRVTEFGKRWPSWLPTTRPCTIDDIVTRIEFSYVDPVDVAGGNQGATESSGVNRGSKAP